MYSSKYWIQVMDGDKRARRLYDRHYSRNEYRLVRLDNENGSEIMTTHRAKREGHYSRNEYRMQDGNGRDYDRAKNVSRLFVGPGEKMVLVTVDGRALFIWRKFVNQDARQVGVNCAVFRNETDPYILSSELILDAEGLAWKKWPGERLYTYVNPSRIRSTNPGCCFIKAGWDRLDYVSKARGYMVLEKNYYANK